METTIHIGDVTQVDVLIVPCGMETQPFSLVRGFYVVLIVPCGMETAEQDERGATDYQVLIVPCGMETQYGRPVRGFHHLY